MAISTDLSPIIDDSTRTVTQPQKKGESGRTRYRPDCGHCSRRAAYDRVFLRCGNYSLLYDNLEVPYGVVLGNRGILKVSH